MRIQLPAAIDAAVSIVLAPAAAACARVVVVAVVSAHVTLPRRMTGAEPIPADRSSIPHPYVKFVGLSLAGGYWPRTPVFKVTWPPWLVTCCCCWDASAVAVFSPLASFAIIASPTGPSVRVIVVSLSFEVGPHPPQRLLRNLEGARGVLHVEVLLDARAGLADRLPTVHHRHGGGAGGAADDSAVREVPGERQEPTAGVPAGAVLLRQRPRRGAVRRGDVVRHRGQLTHHRVRVPAVLVVLLLVGGDVVRDPGIHLREAVRLAVPGVRRGQRQA